MSAFVEVWPLGKKGWIVIPGLAGPLLSPSLGHMLPIGVPFVE